MKLSIGMAVHSDFDGAFFTIQSLRMHHPEVMRDCEIVVIDNDPDSPSGKALHGQTGWWYGATVDAHQRSNIGTPTLGGFQYHKLPSPVGPAGAKDMVFKVAKGDYVLCMDCHILLALGSLRRLLDWWEAHPDSNDLISGPLVYDGLDSFSTHFDDVWRGQMWGTWGSAWRCQCGALFSAIEQGGQLTMAPLLSRYPVQAHANCPRCGRSLPMIQWYGHEPQLKRLGFTSAAEEDGPAFEILAQGMGLFSCRRDAWLGFNPRFIGFGGEEWYIHEKFRQAGHKALCLPGLRWMHRFGRPVGPTYPAHVWNKIRNYIIGHAELGLPMDRMRAHFEGLGVIPDAEKPIWDELLANPLNPPMVKGLEPVRKEMVSMPQPTTLEDLYQSARLAPSDINEHAAKLRELAVGCDTVVEFGKRHGVSTVALLAGQPRRFVSYDSSNDPITEVLQACKGTCNFEFLKGDSLVAEIDPCDLLFIDTVHTGGHLTAELRRHAGKVHRWLAFHDTTIYGEKGEDGAPGLAHAIRAFCEKNPEWFVAYHAPNNNGLTVLGRLPGDRPQQRIWAWAPNKGPGTELKALLKSLGVEPGSSCDCNQRAVQMDMMGVAGCRHHIDEIIGWMRDGQQRWGWKDKLAAAAKAVTTGLVFRLNITDPFPGLVEEAIRRAELKDNDAR